MVCVSVSLLFGLTFKTEPQAQIFGSLQTFKQVKTESGLVLGTK